MKKRLPTDDSPASTAARIEAAESGQCPPMPGLNRMTKNEMRHTLQSIWESLDEAGVPRRNPTSPANTLTLYGRVYVLMTGKKVAT